MAFAGNPYNEAALKKLLNQLLISGMSAPLDNQNLDFRRLHEELLKSTHDISGPEGRMDRGGYRFGEENRLSREQEDLRDRSYQDNIGKNEIRGQDRSNFFGGALDSKDNRSVVQSGPDLSMSQRGRWSSGLGDLDNRMGERMGMGEGNRGPRYDDRGADISGSAFFNQALDMVANFGSQNLPPMKIDDRGADISGSAFFNQALNMAANFRSQNLPFPSSFTGADPLPSNNSSDLWSSTNNQGYTYGMNSAFQLPFTIEPPPPSQPKPNRSEKPLGCHTIFIGGLPDEITEEIIREIMCPCGAIESIRISKGKGDKKFCHLRFIDAESVELAVGYSGYKIFVNNGDQRFGGRVHVDYAKSREDDIQYEKLLKAKEREARKDDMETSLVLFTESAAIELMQSIRSSSGFQESFLTLAQWLERGECTRKSASTFYNLLGAVNGHIKRIVKEKKEYEDIVERQQREQAERAKVITAQGAAIMKVFKAASKKRCWDHFSKAQRRNIDEWHQQVEKEIKISEEEQMGNRQEVGMDLDDEPDHAQTTSEPSQPEEEDSGEPKAKQMKTEDSSESKSETTQAALEAQNIKFRAQNAGLKALAVKNASLMWEVEGYKKEIVTLKHRFASVFQDKDLQIARLMTAVQGLQNFFQHVTLNAPPTSNTEVVVVTDDEPTNDTTEQQTEDTELNSQESSSQVTNEDKPKEIENESKKEEKDEEKEEEKDEEKDEEKEKDKEKEEEEPIDQEVTPENETTEEVTSEEAVTTGEDSTEPTTNEQTAAEENQPENMTEEVSKNEDSTQSACHTEVVRLTSKDMTLVGLLCSYLQICPYGATTEQVLAHVQRQVPGVPAEELEKVLDSLPMLFIGDGLEFYNKTWKFKKVEKVF